LSLGVVRKLRHALGGGGGLGEFVTVQIQNFSFFGKFVTRGGGVKKVVFLCDVICERPLITVL